MAVRWLPANNLLVLQHLAVYRFLTVPQLIGLGVAKHKSTVYDILKRFDRFPRKLIDRKKFNFVSGRGNIHMVLYLTRGGTELLAEHYGVDPGRIKYPRGQTIFVNDYYHRIATIDFHIALRQWAENAGATVDFFETYFDKTGSNRGGVGQRLRAKTRVDVGKEFFNADAIYRTTKSNGSQWLVIFEMHNGHDSGRFLKQLDIRLLALEEGSINDQYEFFDPCILECVFEHESTMRAVIKRVRQAEDLTGFREYVSFNTIENVRTDFAVGWQHF